MSNKLFTVANTGSVLYGNLRNSNGEVWDGTAFVEWSDVDYTDYVINAVEQSTTGFYSIEVPVIDAGHYTIDIKVQDGGSPAMGDLRIGFGQFEWSGEELVNSSSDVKVDNLSLSEALEVILAVTSNVTENLTDKSIAFKDRSGQNNKIIINYGENKGHRTSSTIVG